MKRQDQRARLPIDTRSDFSSEPTEDELQNGSFSAGRVIDRLAALRTDMGISARQLSRELGHSPSYINAIENHRRELSLEGFLAILACLQVTPALFFSDDDPAARQARLGFYRTRLKEEHFDHLMQLARDLAEAGAGNAAQAGAEDVGKTGAGAEAETEETP